MKFQYLRDTQKSKKLKYTEKNLGHKEQEVSWHQKKSNVVKSVQCYQVSKKMGFEKYLLSFMTRESLVTLTRSC